MADLTDRRCKPGAKRLTAEQARERLGQLTGWTIEKDGTELHRTFRFPNYHETMAFVNAVAYVAHREDHHPDLEVGFNRCSIRYTTHDAGGLTESDFVCAARIDRL